MFTEQMDTRALLQNEKLSEIKLPLMFTEQMDTSRAFALASSHVLWLVLFGKRFLHKQFAEMVLSTNIRDLLQIAKNPVCFFAFMSP